MTSFPLQLAVSVGRLAGTVSVIEVIWPQLTGKYHTMLNWSILYEYCLYCLNVDELSDISLMTKAISDLTGPIRSASRHFASTFSIPISRLASPSTP